MTEARPLSGKRILVTRAESQAQPFAEALRALGAEPLFLPGLAMGPPDSYAALDAALVRLDQFDWAVFTSQNAVQAFTARAREAAKDPSRLRVAAVGPKTAKALTAAGLTVELVAEEAVADSLVDALATKVRGKGVLLPRAQEAPELLPDELRKAGAREVCVVAAYKAVAAPDRARAAIVDAFGRGEIDAVTFASARTAQTVVAKLRAALGTRALELLAGSRIFSIGPLTTRACHDLGLTKVVEANPHTVDGMVDSIVETLARAKGSTP